MVKERILIVDDSEQIQDILRSVVLEPLGYRVSSAYNGCEGLRLILEDKPDLVILDEKMPEMTGVELLQALKAREIELPVIFTTIHGSEDLVVQVLRLGARDYIIKPFEPDEMQRAVERILSEVRLRRERDQLVVQLRQANERLERQVQEMRTLYSIGRSVTSLLDLKTILTRVVEAAVFVTRADEGILMLVDEERAELMLRAAKNVDEKVARGLRIRVDDTLAGETIRTGKPVLVTGGHTKVATGYLVQGLVYVPISSPERGIIGVLGVTNRVSQRSFSKHEVQVLSALAAYAAVALDNARLYEKVHQHAADLSHAVERLQELDRLKNEFIQNVSHELRSPLALVRGYAELLHSGELGELQLEQQEPVEVIARRSRMLSSLVEDITLILRAETRPLSREPLAIDELARAAVEDFRVVAGQSDLKLTLEMASNLPLVNGEPNYLRRVLDNLINNAIKFTSPGGKIDIRVWEEKEYVLLQVADTGIGIPPDQQERIFERFYQVDGSSRRRYGGVGLGLALVKELVNLHEGTVQVESEEGKGSTFTVRLPVPV